MNALDKLINYFSPENGLKRAQSRAASSQIQGRAYDIASRSRRTDGWNAGKKSGAAEVSASYSIGADRARELVRNNPLAARIKNIIAANVVGSGVRPNAMTKSDKSQRRLQDEMDMWAESLQCDAERKNSLYGLQYLWFATMVEAGGVFVRRIFDKSAEGVPLRFQTLEVDLLDTAKTGKSGNSYIVDGIQFSSDNVCEGYWLKQGYDDAMAGMMAAESKFYDAKEVFHFYRQDRPSQHLGMTWFAPIAARLKDFDTYKDAKLMQQQIAACFGALIEGAESGVGSPSDINSDLPVDSIEPGMIEYLAPGQKVHTLSPPKADNASQMEVSLQRDMAVGTGITYEMLTGDYSKVNYASGRMGKNEFFTNLDIWQQTLMLPLLNWVAESYLLARGMAKGNANLKIEWTFPPRALTEPDKELDTLIAQCRAGIISPTELSKKFGKKLPDVLEQWKKDKARFDSLDLVFDHDPSKYAKTGNQIMEGSAALEPDKEQEQASKQAEAEADRAFLDGLGRIINESHS